ncbi:MAG: DUF3147 family protein [Planctomycetes bacterium]|nr:DUF3147 family protein [Planctomycetota bacterium]
MRFVVKVVISLCVILVCTQIAKKMPSLAGLIGVMPLTGALIMVWVFLDNSGDVATMTSFTKGALWGIVPSVPFFVTALFCFRSRLNLPVTLVSSFAVWAIGAFVHQRLLG